MVKFLRWFLIFSFLLIMLVLSFFLPKSRFQTLRWCHELFFLFGLIKKFYKDLKILWVFNKRLTFVQLDVQLLIIRPILFLFSWMLFLPIIHQFQKIYLSYWYSVSCKVFLLILLSFLSNQKMIQKTRVWHTMIFKAF